MPILLFLFAAAVYLLTATVPNLSIDVWASYFLSWQLADGGGPWVDGVTIPGITGHPGEFIWVIEAANGHQVIGRSPGTVVAGLPAYWFLGGDAPSTFPGGLTAAVMTAVTVVLFFLAVRPRSGVRVALLATGVLAFTTPVWSVAANGLWPHTVTILGIAGAAWAAQRERWWLVGVFGGVLVWGRLHAAVIVAVVGLGIAWSRRSPRVAAIIGGISLGFLGLLCVWDRWMYGTWSPMASYDVGAFAEYAVDHRFDLMNQLALWVSDRGILVWTPVLAVLVPALVRSWRGLPDWSRWLLVAGVVYTVLQGVLNRYSGGDSFFPYRLGLEFLLCAGPALTFAVVRTGQRVRLWMGPLIALQFCFVFLGSGLVEALSPGPEERGGFFGLLVTDYRVPAMIGLLVVVLGLGLAPKILADRLATRRSA